MLSRINQLRFSLSLSCSQKVFFPEKWSSMTNYCAISFVMRQPRSADCSNKERRRSISVLLYLLLLFVIIPSNYGVFSFASFSEASTAVVFIAKLVDLIMETPVDLHYKSKLFLLLLFWKITCNLIRVGWGIGILWSQSLIYLFVTLQLWSSGSELLAEFIWVFVFVHFY